MAAAASSAAGAAGADFSGLPALETLDDASLPSHTQSVAPAGMGMPGGPGGMGGAPRQLKPEEFKHFVSIYPCYLNAEYSSAQGRRLPLDKLLGCSNPWPQDIAEAAARLGLGPLIVLEGKRHPRDFFVAGRVRVELKTPEGVLKVPAIPTKEKLLEELARVIPTLESRRRRLAQMEAARAQQAARMAAGPPGVKVSAKKKDKKRGK